VIIKNAALKTAKITKRRLGKDGRYNEQDKDNSAQRAGVIDKRGVKKAWN
jgi:hypothetical protein